MLAVHANAPVLRHEILGRPGQPTARSSQSAILTPSLGPRCRLRSLVRYDFQRISRWGMADYFEIDFLSVGERQSGDAIALRYRRDGNTFVHVADGGFQDDGSHGHGSPSQVLRRQGMLVMWSLTPPDSDHAGGLRSVLEECAVAPGAVCGCCALALRRRAVRSLRTVHDRERSRDALREAYPDVAALEEIAQRRRILSTSPFQGGNDRRVHGPRAVEGAVSPPDRGLREDTEGCWRSQHGASQGTPIGGSPGSFTTPRQPGGSRFSQPSRQARRTR